MAANVHDVIMLLGDSITQGGWEPDLNGFGQRLARQFFLSLFLLSKSHIFFSDVYARKLDVLNRGLSGYNTEWAIPVFEQVSLLYFLLDENVCLFLWKWDACHTHLFHKM